MVKSHKVAVKVTSQKGSCAAQHKVGDEWVIQDRTPPGMCLAAFYALYPDARVLAFGGQFPWQTDPDITMAACPDAANPVVFELRRLKD